MRRIVFALVALGFVALEVFVLVQVAGLIGWWIVPLLVLTSLAGGWLVKREGAKAWAALRDALRNGEAPSGKLGDTAVVFAGGLLILLPGFVTDALGALVVLPFTRPVTRRLFAAAFGSRIADLENAVPPTFPPPTPPGSGSGYGPTAPGYGPTASGAQGGPPESEVVQGRVISADDRREAD